MGAYFDHNATTPMSEAAREAWLTVEKSHWHNPSSLYREAGAASRLLEDLREEAADRLGCSMPERVVFTSGASEANNAVLRHMAAAGTGKIAISSIEHPSVRDPARACFESVVEIPVGAGGAVAPDAIDLENVDLVSVMAANNETGVEQPWRELAAFCRDAGKRFHCDAAQWIGKRPCGDLGECDFVTGCAHKFGGPKGVGFVVLPEDLASGEASGSVFSLALGGPQENRHRAGTENLPGIAAMMAAWRGHDDFLAAGHADQRAAERDAFEADLRREIDGFETVPADGDARRLWNTSMMVAPAHSNLKWLTRLSRRGFSVSTGSACSAGKGNPSHVMAAMGLDHEAMGRVIRFSGGWDTSGDDWRAMGAALVDAREELESGGRDRKGGGLAADSDASLFGPPD